MKATVLVRFRDKHNHKVVFEPGEVKDFDNDRVAALAARGLVKPLEETPVDPGNDSANATSAKNGALKASGKGKGKGKSSKKDKEATAEAVVPETENEVDKPESDDGQVADATAESESETETESKDNE